MLFLVISWCSQEVLFISSPTWCTPFLKRLCHPQSDFTVTLISCQILPLLLGITPDLRDPLLVLCSIQSEENLSLFFFSSFLWPYFVTEDTISSWVHVSHSPFWKLMCHHFSRKGDSCFLQAPSLPCPVYFRADNRWGWDTNTTFQTMKSQVQGELDSSSIGRLQNYKLVQK